MWGEAKVTAPCGGDGGGRNSALASPFRATLRINPDGGLKPAATGWRERSVLRSAVFIRNGPRLPRYRIRETSSLGEPLGLRKRLL